MTLDEWLAQNQGQTTFENSLAQQGYTQNPDTGYWYSPDGSRVSTDTLQQMQDSYNPTNTYLQSAMYGSAGQQDPSGQLGYATANINGTPYAQIGQFANNGTDPYSSLQQEFQHLSQYGITPQYDQTYGWIAPVNDAYSQAHPYQNNSSIFDYGPILLGTAAVGGGLFGGAYDLGAAGAASGAAGAGASAIPDVLSFTPEQIASGAYQQALEQYGLGSLGTPPLVDSGIAGALGGTAASTLGVPAQQAPAPVTEAGQAASAADIARIGANGPLSAATQTALSRILSGNYTASDMASVLGTLGASGLGALSANQQANAFSDVANKFMGLGAPYRDKLLASYSPNFSLSNEPGYQDALNNSTNTFLRAASAGRAPGVSGGNPFDNPGAWAETLKYVNSNTALPYLQNYRSGLAGAGGLGVNASAAPFNNSATASGGVLGSLGYGLQQLTNPQPNWNSLLGQLLTQPKSNTTLNNGGPV